MVRTGFMVAIVGLLSCVVIESAPAQVTWEGGIRAGLALGKLRGDTRILESETDGTSTITLSGDVGDMRTGFAGGAFAGVRVTERFAVRLEVLYTQKGGKGPVDVTIDSTAGGSADLTFKLDYVEVPLLAVVSFPAGTRATVDLFGGPAVAFKSSAKLAVSAGGFSDETDIGDTVKGTDFGLTVGAGITLRRGGKVAFLVDGRYSLGLTEFPDASPSVNLKNNALAFTAGISFPLGPGTMGY